MWRQGRTGSVEMGKDADLMIVRGDPFTYITAIEYVEMVVKRGTAPDSSKLLDSVRGPLPGALRFRCQA
jgi:imidazolonepropionase-like amidohydrolase